MFSKIQVHVEVEYRADYGTSVANYTYKTATLVLEHNHPSSNAVRALVDVTLQLATLKSTDTRVGEWVHVIGYVQAQSQEASRDNKIVPIQAIILWPTGPFQLHTYEKTLDD